VNRFSDGREPPSIPTPDYSALERGQVERVRAMRAKRDAVAVKSVLHALRETSRGSASSTATQPPLMPLIIDAVRARATVGEIADAFRSSWSEYRPA
jgi:methylmalonyl-CoA mutase N-terminal domain/subunit